MKKRNERIYHYDVVFDQNGDGYTVTVPSIPGLVTEGDTLSEARAMAKDAIRCALKAVLKGKPTAPLKTKQHAQRERIAIVV